MRRNLIAGGAALMVGTLATRVSASATVGAAPKTIALVHGAWHGAAHWGAVAQRLTEREHRVVAVDLPGHGLGAQYPKSYVQQDLAALAVEPSPLKDLTLDIWAGAVVAAMKAAAPRGGVTLVGHSMSGVVVTKAAEMAPHLVHRLVYLAAFCPVALPNMLPYLGLPENATQLGREAFISDPAKTGAVRINPRSTDPAYLEGLRAAYYGDLSFDAFLPFASLLSPELPVLPLTADARGTADRWGRLPRTFIRCSEDHALPIPLADRMIREANHATPTNPFDVKTVVSSHCAFASQPRALADLLEGLG